MGTQRGAQTLGMHTVTGRAARIASRAPLDPEDRSYDKRTAVSSGSHVRRGRKGYVDKKNPPVVEEE